MEKVYVGKIVNTHGIKGELRILSSFEWKEKVFFIGNKLYIGKKDVIEEIATYRKHKNFDMVTFKGYQNINEVLKYKGLSVYVTRESLHLKDNEYLDRDLIGFAVFMDQEKKGVLSSIRTLAKGNKILEIDAFGKKVNVPYQKEFIQKIDGTKKEIHLVSWKGLFE